MANGMDFNSFRIWVEQKEKLPLFVRYSVLEKDLAS
jgi:hypothetical protein